VHTPTDNSGDPPWARKTEERDGKMDAPPHKTKRPKKRGSDACVWGMREETGQGLVGVPVVEDTNPGWGNCQSDPPFLEEKVDEGECEPSKDPEPYVRSGEVFNGGLYIGGKKGTGVTRTLILRLIEQVKANSFFTPGNFQKIGGKELRNFPSKNLEKVK